MLVVDEVLPGSTTEGKLQPGDILTHVNGRLVTTFEPLEEILDAAVGRTVDITVERGGERIAQTLPVGDLHAITPAEYFEFGDAVVHALSYQMARHFNAPVRGVFVANPGYVLNAAGVPRGAVITSVGRQARRDARRLRAGGRRAAARRARHAALLDARRPEGLRDARDAHGPHLVPGAALPPRRPDRTLAVRTEGWAGDAGGAAQEPRARRRSRRATTSSRTASRNSLVLVSFDMPFSVAGITERNYHGTGVIVDAERGLVVVDRNTVPVAPGDVQLTFGGSVEVPGASSTCTRCTTSRSSRSTRRCSTARRCAPRGSTRPISARASPSRSWA